MTDNNENVKQRARRLAKAYAEEFLKGWKDHDRKWMQFAFTRGYRTACENLVGDTDNALSDEAFDAVLDFYDTREQVTA